MQKILGISGSPRKPGNCEIMLKAVCRHVPEEHELHLLRLADFDLRPCKGCYRCLFKEKKCILKDDIGLIIEALAWADAVIVAVWYAAFSYGALPQCLCGKPDFRTSG